MDKVIFPGINIEFVLAAFRLAPKLQELLGGAPYKSWNSGEVIQVLCQKKVVPTKMRVTVLGKDAMREIVTPQVSKPV